MKSVKNFFEYEKNSSENPQSPIGELQKKPCVLLKQLCEREAEQSPHFVFIVGLRNAATVFA
jgi:hypothetical protein